jgi:hypothetical protein
MSAPSLRRLWIRAAVVAGAMILLDLPLRTAASPNGVVSFELAWTRGHAAAIIASWTGLAAASAWGSLLLDYLFMWSYASLFAALAHRAFAGGAGTALAGASWAAAGCDALENVALIRMYGWGATSGAAVAAGTFASVKFVLLGVVVLALAGAAVRRRLTR